MGKKKGKLLALELVGDLFDKNNSKEGDSSNKLNAVPEPPTEVLGLPELVSEESTTQMNHAELFKPTVVTSHSPSKAHDISGDITLGAALNQSENLKKAQDKILHLETVIEELRKENEKLLSATESLSSSDQDLQKKIKDLKSQLLDSKDQYSDEKKILIDGKGLIEKELRTAQLEIDQLNSRLSTNLKKIRVRERELENRLEILKLESDSLQRTKDERLLELKRQIDDSQFEIDGFKQKGDVLDLELQKNKNMLRKTVKALRLALTMLEMDEQQFQKLSGDES